MAYFLTKGDGPLPKNFDKSLGVGKGKIFDLEQVWKEAIKTKRGERREGRREDRK